MYEFKIGDWVIVTTSGGHISTNQITSIPDHVHIRVNDQNLLTVARACVLWEPKTNEWCWFWNTGEPPILDRLHKHYDLNDHLGNYETQRNCLYQHCEPFIGQLPTIIKD